MDAELEFHLNITKQLHDKAYQYAWDHLVQPLSKAVLEKATRDNDQRTMLGLVNMTNDYKYETTDEFRTWVALFWDMTAEARAQMFEINAAGYCCYENISMMLESCDYFKDDIWKMILLATLYVQGRFDPSLPTPYHPFERRQQ